MCTTESTVKHCQKMAL